MKLLQIQNSAPHYKGTIYRMMDKEIGCDWVIGNHDGDIKRMDLSTLTNDVKIIHRVFINICGKHIGRYMVGMPGLIRANYDTYLIADDMRGIATWFFLIRKSLFYRTKRVFCWGHGELGKEGRLKQLFYRWFYSMCDGAFIYNERSCNLMAERGIPKEKLHTIYNSLDYDKQLLLRQLLKPMPLYRGHFGNDYKTIVFIGRLTKVKRLDLLLDAVAELKRRGEPVNLTFVGNGVEKHNMEERVIELGIKDQVWFYGACYDEKTNAELIFNADLCVSPGNIGLTAIHVLMFGCPAITNDDFDHQMPEFEAIKDRESGAFFNAGNSNSLADAISYWFFSHRTDREIVRQACYKEIDTKWNPHNQMNIFKRVLLQTNLVLGENKFESK